MRDNIMRARFHGLWALSGCLLLAACQTLSIGDLVSNGDADSAAKTEQPGSSPTGSTLARLDQDALAKAELSPTDQTKTDLHGSPKHPALAAEPNLLPCDPVHIQDNNARLAPFEMRRIQNAIEACWRPLKGAPFDMNLKVVLGVNLAPDGKLIGKPDILQAPDPVSALEFSDAALARAHQALDSCLPFDLPKEKYAAWCRMELAFDPKTVD